MDEVITSEELLECANEIISAKIAPPIAECFDKDPIVPRDAWLSAIVLACYIKGIKKND